MTDVHDDITRSYNMSRIRNANTNPELLVRKFLFNKGFRFRINDNALPGKPDIVLKKFHSVIFINGCFWHAHHNCRYYKLPKTNSIWWENKLKANIERDNKNYKLLQEVGWKVIIVWECELKPEKRKENLKYLDQILREKPV